MQQTTEVMDYAYFMPSGEILVTTGRSPDTDHMNQADTVIVNHPADGSSAPFVEIIKARRGPASIIATA